MGKGGGRRRVGQVVGRHVNRLDRSYRTFAGRGNAFLQGAHFLLKGRLVTDGAGQAAQQSGDFGAGLGIAENVVDEQQNVVASVAEAFGNGQAAERHP